MYSESGLLFYMVVLFLWFGVSCVMIGQFTFSLIVDMDFCLFIASTITCLLYISHPHQLMDHSSAWFFSLGEQWAAVIKCLLFSAAVPWKLCSTVAVTTAKRSKGNGLPMNGPLAMPHSVFIDLLCFDTIQIIIERKFLIWICTRPTWWVNYLFFKIVLLESLWESFDFYFW